MLAISQKRFFCNASVHCRIWKCTC